MEASDFTELQRVSSVAVGPSGRRTVFSLTEYEEATGEPRSSLVWSSLPPAGGVGRLTRCADAHAPAWDPAGNRLAFLSTRDPDVEGATGSAPDDVPTEPRPQVWVLDFDAPGEPRQVTWFDAGVEAFDWGPHGERIVAAVPSSPRSASDGPITTELTQHKFHGAGWLDDSVTSLQVVSIADGTTTSIDGAYGAGVFAPSLGLQPAWNPGTDEIAFLSQRDDDPESDAAMDVYLADATTGEVTRVTDGTAFARGPAWSPSGDRLAFAAGSATDPHVPAQVYVADGDGSWESLTASLDRTLVADPVWLDDATVGALVADGGQYRLVQVAVEEGTTSPIDVGLGDDETVLGFDGVGTSLAFVLARHDSTPAVYWTDYRTDEGRRSVFRTSEAFFESHTTPAFERVNWENDAGDRIEGLLYTPAREDPPYPLVVSVHGGPVACAVPEFVFDYAYWADDGYAVFVPNYRGSTSYGYDFSAAIAGDWGPREVEDVTAGVEALVERGVAAPDRVFGIGTSYGATLLVRLLADTDRFTAGAADQGIYDFRSAYGGSDARVWLEQNFGLPWENPETYESISPITDVDRIATPTILLAGGNDLRCPVFQAEQLHVSLKRSGTDSRLVHYPDAHHGFDGMGGERAVHRLEEITRWFDTYDPDPR